MVAKTIAIDGAAGSGKSTVGRLVAEKLGYSFLDAGKLYRALTAQLLIDGVQYDDADKVIAALTTIKMTVAHNQDHVSPNIIVNGRAITSELHSVAINRAVPLVAALPATRAIIKGLQKHFAKGGQVVYSGRDIGTVILPDADLKIFLDVSLAERARRRLQDIHDETVTLQAVIQMLQQRDEKDTKRAHSPLKIADDAHVLKTDAMQKSDVLALIIALAREGKYDA